MGRKWTFNVMLNVKHEERRNDEQTAGQDRGKEER